MFELLTRLLDIYFSTLLVDTSLNMAECLAIEKALSLS
jgi:hypothetical protein